MEAQSYIKCACAHCGGHIEAPAEGAGMWIRCPHCGEKTQLIASVEKKAQPRKMAGLWIGIVLAVIVGLSAVAAIFIFKRNQTTEPKPAIVHQNSKAAQPATASAPAAEPEPDLWKGLKPGPVSIEKSPKSRLVYAIGSIRNDTDKQRFGVKVVLDVLDANGEKLGTTTDYTQFIDAHKEWSFKALVTDSKAASAKVTSITEE